MMISFGLYLAFFATSSAIDLPPMPFDISFILPYANIYCYKGAAPASLHETVQSCTGGTENLPENSVEATIANVCRLAPIQDSWNAKTKEVNTCVKGRCRYSPIFEPVLNILVVPCGTVLEQILPGCTFEGLQAAVTKCLQEANIDPQLGLAVLSASITDVNKALCNIYSIYRATAYDKFRTCLVREKCPNIPELDFATCDAQIQGLVPQPQGPANPSGIQNEGNNGANTPKFVATTRPTTWLAKYTTTRYTTRLKKN